jgi:predicted enzyme related to lactoylglutathione lyase
MNGPSYFEIQADDLKRAIEFYRSLFGWSLTRSEGLPIRGSTGRERPGIGEELWR